MIKIELPIETVNSKQVNYTKNKQKEKQTHADATTAKEN